MNKFRLNIWEAEEYSYIAAYGFEPNIMAYLHDDDIVRDCMLVVPGGGYCMVVPSEAENVAKEFYARGMNAFVLTYTTDITMSVPLKDQPLKDISRAVRIIRRGAGNYHINPNKIVICGFSAGGHVCGILMTHFSDVKDSNPKYSEISNRPDAVILSYPVVTTGSFTHIYSVQALLGYKPTKEELYYYSVEKNVTADTPPCFIWQTATDDCVPVENSYLLAKSLKENSVPFAHFVFPNGGHGLSVATKDFFEGNHGEEYTFEQLHKAIDKVRNHTAVNVSKEREEELIIQFSQEDNNTSSGNTDELVDKYRDVRMWPDLAMNWINNL